MPEPKTKKTKVSVAAFIDALANDTRRKDAKAVDRIYREITGEKPAMWGPSIVGFGSQRLVYESGRELDWPLLAFSPRKANTVLYLSLCGYEKYGSFMKKLGKHKTGKSCLYIKKLSDVDVTVLKALMKRSLEDSKSR